jgi:hypothetical protein
VEDYYGVSEERVNGVDSSGWFSLPWIGFSFVPNASFLNIVIWFISSVLNWVEA